MAAQSQWLPRACPAGAAARAGCLLGGLGGGPKPVIGARPNRALTAAQNREQKERKKQTKKREREEEEEKRNREKKKAISIRESGRSCLLFHFLVFFFFVFFFSFLHRTGHLSTHGFTTPPRPDAVRRAGHGGVRGAACRHLPVHERGGCLPARPPAMPGARRPSRAVPPPNAILACQVATGLSVSLSLSSSLWLHVFITFITCLSCYR